MMKNACTYGKKLTAVWITLIMLLLTLTPAFAASDRLELKLSIGSGSMAVNGTSVKIEKPFLAKDIPYVPLSAVLKAFGGEVRWNNSGKILVYYRNASVELQVGSAAYTSNQTAKSLSQPVKLVNHTTMVPLQLISENFYAKTQYDAKSKKISIFLEEDGALSDLSFLTGGISHTRVGNSYFGWSIGVPKSSRIINISFNSKSVTIENEHRQITLDIWVNPAKDKKLKELAEEEKASIGGNQIFDSSINEKARPAYAELLYKNRYEEAVWERIYVNKGNVYYIVLTGYGETNPRKLQSSTYYKGIMNSLKLDYKGNSKDTEELSRVSFGNVRYDSYISFDNGNKYFTWGMDVPPEWDNLKTSESDILSAKIGASNKEYIHIKVDKAQEHFSGEIEEIANQALEFYDYNFNPEYYSLIDSAEVNIAGYKAYRLKYELTLNNEVFSYEESYIAVDDLIYDITIKCPKDEYAKKKSQFDKALESIQLAPATTVLEQDIDNHKNRNVQSLVGKDEEMTAVQSKNYKWSMKVPGYWSRRNAEDESFQMFVNDAANAGIAVEAAENNAQTREMGDEEKFRFLRSLISVYDMKQIKTENSTEKGHSVRTLTYRLISDDDEMYGDVKCRIVEKDKLIYCFYTIIPDLYMSEGNMGELTDMWESFLLE
jgi:hypothetical protein